MFSLPSTLDYRPFSSGLESYPPKGQNVLFRNALGAIQEQIRPFEKAATSGQAAADVCDDAELGEDSKPTEGGASDAANAVAEQVTDGGKLRSAEPDDEPTAKQEEKPLTPAKVQKVRTTMQDIFGMPDILNAGSRGQADADAPPRPVELPDGPFLVYRHRISDRNRTMQVFEVSSFDPIVDTDDADVKDGKASRKPVFEVIDDFVSVEKDVYHPYTMPLVLPEVRRSITIRSEPLIDAIQSVVGDYPGADLKQSTLTLQSPYAMLVHYYQELTALRNKVAAAKAADDDLRGHLSMLLTFLDDDVMTKVREERERQARGKATFEMLWLAFRPGDKIARINFTSEKRGGVANRDAAVVKKCEVLGFHCSITSWSLDFDGECITKASHTSTIPSFDGEVDLVQLDACPLRLAKDPTGGPLEDYLCARGQEWYHLLKRPWCKHLEGDALTFPFQNMSGMVMVDVIAWMEGEDMQGDTVIDPVTGMYKDRRRYPGNLSYMRRRQAMPYGRFDDPEESGVEKQDPIRPQLVSEMERDQYLLCPQKIAAWHFKSREWIDVAVCHLGPARYDSNMINVLVMDEERSTLLKALANGFGLDENGKPRQDHWAADHVEGKGNSQIFLLHGPPGVGKTFTAECISGFTLRPLMTLTANDIGTKASSVESNLRRIFKLAKKWNAIILIDEADIYLERRSQQDLERNGLVAGFLRAMEIYEGILFLTTNRVGAFDDAFISRIHVKLSYPPLNDKDRKQIWENFFNKLRREKGKTFRIEPEVEDFLELNKIKKLNLNGREIRNIFQTAVDLARYYNVRDESDRICIQRKHLEQVVDMSAHFKSYLDTLLVHNEADRAKYGNLRIDDHDPNKVKV